jgi:hypothetical protein
MKGIYLTEEGKQEIKAKILEILKTDIDDYYGNAALLKEILSSAIILPVEESWEYVNELYDGVRKQLYPQGIIIQPKS